MGNTTDQTMSRVVKVMYERIGDELTVDDLARTAMYSKFHFSRMFRQVTGVSPGRFLSELRFQEAKRLLVSTSLSVAEISNRVGYSSLGTFSTRFKKFVGLTPTEYRRTGGGCAFGVTEPVDPEGVEASATICGRIAATVAGDCGQTFVGLFRDPVPHRAPVRATVLTEPGPYQLVGVPAGSWYLLAHGVFADRNGVGDGPAILVGSVGRYGPITVGPDGVVATADIQLRPMRMLDLPVLAAPFVTRPRELCRPVVAPVRVAARESAFHGRRPVSPPMAAPVGMSRSDHSAQPRRRTVDYAS